MSIHRRSWLIAALAGTGSLTADPSLAAAPAIDALAALERRRGGRLGVAVVDLGWTAADAVPHMPVAEGQDPKAGLPIGRLAEAAQKLSDNLAANLLLRHLGGPAAFTRWLREQGDAVTRLDRIEPAMNGVAAGDERDTTTPAAMAANLLRLLRGPMLAEPGRERLLGWMRETRTGQRRLRAGLPAGWTAGDKTGTGLDAHLPDRINDLAVFWPPGGRAPIVIAAYYEGPRRGSAQVRPRDEAVLAAVGQLAAR